MMKKSSLTSKPTANFPKFTLSGAHTQTVKHPCKESIIRHFLLEVNTRSGQLLKIQSIIHADSSSLMPSSLESTNHFLCFPDKFSKYRKVYLTKGKHEIAAAFDYLSSGTETTPENTQPSYATIKDFFNLQDIGDE